MKTDRNLGIECVNRGTVGSQSRNALVTSIPRHINEAHTRLPSFSLPFSTSLLLGRCYDISVPRLQLRSEKELLHRSRAAGL